MHKGTRIALPAGAPLVYTSRVGDHGISGGNTVELADACISSLLTKLDLPEKHLSFICGELPLGGLRFSKCTIIFLAKLDALFCVSVYLSYN